MFKMVTLGYFFVTLAKFSLSHMVTPSFSGEAAAQEGPNSGKEEFPEPVPVLRQDLQEAVAVRQARADTHRGQAVQGEALCHGFRHGTTARSISCRYWDCSGYN